MMREANRVAFWDEPTFWYLLTVEAARARRAERPFLVLLVDARGAAGSPDARATSRLPDLVTALARCLRETDLVGWHRTGRTAGALLTQGEADPAAARLVGSKVLPSLQASMPSEVARALRVRIYRYGVTGGRIGFDRVFAASSASEAMAPASPTPWLTESIVSPPARI